MVKKTQWLILILLCASSGCDRNYKSSIPGDHWHTNGTGGERFLVETSTGHVLYWMYENSAGTCTAQDNLEPTQFTEDFVDCDAAARAIEKRELHKLGATQ